jgi:glycosyltransferase involved in cell wall biosynthesis
MKLTHIISGLSTGGAEMMLYKLLSAWDHRQDEIGVVSLTDRGVLGDRIEKLGFAVRALGLPRGRPSLPGMIRLARWLRQRPPNVLQTWMYHSDLVGGLAAKLAGRIPVVWGVRNGLLEPNSSKRLTIWTAKTCACLSRVLPKKIVCVSEAARQFHVNMGYAEDRMAVIPNGFDLAVFKPNPAARVSVGQELRLPASAVLVGLIARFDPQKDHQNLVQAASIVTNSRREVYFVLCGDGVTAGNQQLHDWIIAGGLVGRFHLLGRRDDIPRLTAALDIAVNSSFGEAFPNVLGEAMACCVPCVATDVGDSAMIIGDTGKVVPPKDPQRLAEALNSMIELGVAGRKQLGEKARRRVQENFDLSVIRDRYAALYREVAARWSSN